ncbi:MAG: ATP-grasp domain-containing protein [Promethearchaeota archaeon]
MKNPLETIENLGETNLVRLYKYLFCIDTEIISGDLIKQACNNNDINLNKQDVKTVLELMDAKIVDEKWYLKEKEEYKKIYFKSKKLKIALINGREDEGNSYRRFKEETIKKKINHDEYLLDNLSIHDGNLSGFNMDDDYDFIILGNPELLESDSAPVFILKSAILEKLGSKFLLIPTIQQDLAARSKVHSDIILSHHDISFPETFVTGSISKALNFVEKQHEKGKDIVIKPVAKGGGWAVSKIPVGTKHSQIVDLLGKYKWWYGAGVLYLQEFIPNAGFDKRVLILDGIIMGVEERYATLDGESWIYNISKGGTGKIGSLNEAEKKLIKRTMKASHQYFAGIDVISDVKGKPYILELNSCPGFAGFEKHLNFNVAAFVLNHLIFFR